MKKKTTQKRNITDARKGIRQNLPKISKDIEKLADAWVGSAEQKAHKERFKRR